MILIQYPMNKIRLVLLVLFQPHGNYAAWIIYLSWEQISR